MDNEKEINNQEKQGKELDFSHPAKLIKEKQNAIYYAGSIIFILLVIVFLHWQFNYKIEPAKPQIAKKAPDTIIATTTPAGPNLPGDFGNGDGEGDGFSALIGNLKAEDINFGHFYKKEESDFKPSIAGFDLPINIKADLTNYYDLSRKINLDPYIGDLNQYAFAIMSNTAANVDNFFDMNRYLAAKGIPVLVTSDFIFYVFQNTCKQVFKEIEKNAFFENVWDLNTQLYNISLTRYKQRLGEVGLLNDPILEGERLEVAFFAVALKLLMPTEKQINYKINFTDAAKFDPQEVDRYNFNIPEYLRESVEAEVALIKGAKSQAKSPITLYERNYKDFQVPDNYSKNAKLNNFYLALKWLNTLFPLYARDAGCEDCLLDHDDEIINFVAASLIVEDLSENQELKNQWAIIYKFISYFSGLRQDLTYLHYHDALVDLFGEEYSIEDIFSPANASRQEDIKNLQDKIVNYNFTGMEGVISRSDPKFKPRLGMRLLQETYWPNDYIFGELTGADLKVKNLDQPKNVITRCGKQAEAYRCKGIGRDIINLLYPIHDDEYFTVNTDYLNYGQRVGNLRGQLADFDVFTWNNNIYWTSLDILKSLLYYERADSPVFARSVQWQVEKNLNTALGAWANLHLAEDNYSNYFEQQDSKLGAYADCNIYNYVEPNINFIAELSAKSNMLIGILGALKVTEKTNAASAQLKDMNNKLDSLKAIMRKELAGKEINKEDCRFINDFISCYAVINKADKEFSVKFGDNKLRTTESIKGIKLVAVVNRHNDKKIIAIGPIFNYQEKP